MFGNDFPLTNRLDLLRREMDRLWDGFGAGLARLPFGQAAYPAMNVWDEGETICVEAEVPGVRKDHLEVVAVGNELTLKGRRAPLEGKLAYHRRERGTGEFVRMVTLPCEVNPDKVEATLDNGVLLIRLPKAETAKPRQISIKAG